MELFVKIREYLNIIINTGSPVSVGERKYNRPSYFCMYS